jgi:hypothetical protein
MDNPVFTPITMAEVAGHYAKAGEDEQATTVLKQALAIAQRYWTMSPYRTMTLIGIANI